FGQGAAHVLNSSAFWIDLAAEIPSGVAVDVDEGLELNAELARIAEDHAMGGRDARWAGVEVKPRIECRALVGASHLHAAIAAPDRPAPPADPVARFQHRHTVTRPLQLIGRNEA